MTCLRGGVFHLATPDSPHGCVQQSDLELDSTYTCLPCKNEVREEELQKGDLAVAAELRNDATVAAGFNDPAAASGENEAGVVAADDAASASPGPSLLVAARPSRGIPSHATAFVSWLTPDQFSDHRAALARSKRGGFRISRTYVPFLEK